MNDRSRPKETAPTTLRSNNTAAASGNENGSALPSATRERTAIVFLRNGKTFEGSVTVGGGLVTVAGKLRVRAYDYVHYPAEGCWSFPLRQITEIRWGKP